MFKFGMCFISICFKININSHFVIFQNFNPNDPQCQGIKGVLDAYYHSLKNVQLYGPTNFSPVINRVAG